MNIYSNGVATIALLIALAAVLYARKSMLEAKKANDIGRLNTLWSFRHHYQQELSDNRLLLSNINSNGSLEDLFLARIEELESKLKPISKEIDDYHLRYFECKA